MHKGYFGEPGAQIHYRVCASSGKENHEPLLCLPPAPHSGLYFHNVMEKIAKGRKILAVDYPGYGGSDALSATPTIENYANSLADFCFDQGPVDVLGFHSGCLIALELAITIPEMIGNIILIDVPYFENDMRSAYREKFPKKTALPNSASDLENHFEAQITKRLGDLDHPRAYELFVETLRTGERLNHMFRAAFEYDCEAKFLEFADPIDVVATQGPLLEATRKAAKVLKNASLTECLDIKGAVFETGAEAITKTILKLLPS